MLEVVGNTKGKGILRIVVWCCLLLLMQVRSYGGVRDAGLAASCLECQMSQRESQCADLLTVDEKLIVTEVC
jgi:hypothetical protein